MPRDFADRVKELRDERKLSQNELATAAGISPATFSRILSDERPLRMEQAVALARALGVTVIELTAKTTAEGTVAEWVPQQEYDAADRLRADAECDLQNVRRELEATRAENATLREGVKALTSRVADLEAERVALKAEAARAAQLAKKNGELERKILDLQSEAAGLRSQVEQLHEQAAVAMELANRNYHAWAVAKTQIGTLEKTLDAEKSEKVGVAFVSAALGGLAAAMIASPAETGRKRRS